MASTSSRVARSLVGGWPGRLVLASLMVATVVTGVVAPGPDPTPPVDHQVLALGVDVASPGAQRRLDTSVDARAVGFTWEGANYGAVEFRVRRDGAWTDWHLVEGDSAEGPDHPSPGNPSPEYRGRVSAGPVWVGGRSRQVEVRVVAGLLSDLSVHAIDPRPGGSGAVAPAGADAPRPAFVLRSQWGADESWRTVSPGCDGTPDYAPRARYAVVHHTDTANDYQPDEVPAILRAIYSFHVFSNGWCDIGYNVIVDRFGTAWEGRAGGLDRAVVGAHAAGFNTGSTGVAVLGRFHDDTVPQVAYDGLKSALWWLTFHHGIDPQAQMAVVAAGTGDPSVPAGSVVTHHGVTGHRDLANTLCPGDKGAALLPTLRAELSDLHTSTPTFPLAGWQPTTSHPAVATVDAHGRVIPAGSQPAVAQTGSWPGWSVVRSGVRFGTGGYVLDMFGGLHAFGGVPGVSATGYWSGWDIARDVVARPGPARSGYVLTGLGSLHPFGGAPALSVTGYWPGWDIARSVVLDGTGAGGYVLTGFGSLHPVGNAPPVAAGDYWPDWDVARAVGLRPDGRSGWVLTALGSLHPFGGAPAVSSGLWSPHAQVARDIVVAPDGGGGWVLDDSGRLWPFGSAPAVVPHLTYTGQGLGRAAF